MLHKVMQILDSSKTSIFCQPDFELFYSHHDLLCHLIKQGKSDKLIVSKKYLNIIFLSLL